MMKTILFYSYKGGQGRTTALANIGACMYRLGLNVVMLDLDITCPGLPFKFGIPLTAEFGSPLPESGVVEYVADAVRRREFSVDSLSECVVNLPFGGGNPAFGHLSLIPTGRMTSRYFNKLGTESWRLLSESTTKQVVDYWQKLQAAVARLQPPPDYLLVDLGSGITPIGEIVMTAFQPSPVVVFFAIDQESLDGTRFAMSRIEHIGEDRLEAVGLPRQAMRFHPVVSRTASFVTATEGERLRKIAAEGLFSEATRFNEIHTLHSDFELQRRWFLHFSLEGEIDYLPLTRQYISLISELLGGSWTATALRKALRLPDRVNDYYKVFRRERGRIFNSTDQQPNVSLKVATLIRLVEALASYALPATGAPRPADAPIDGPVHDAGLLCGRGFGRSLMQEFWDESERARDLSTLVAEWCEFDSEVGFGEFSCHELRETPNGLTGVIEVGDNFLTYERTKDQGRLCDLMAGYIGGVLQGITGADGVEVTHADSVCMQQTDALRACSFAFVAKISNETRKPYPGSTS